MNSVDTTSRRNTYFTTKDIATIIVFAALTGVTSMLVANLIRGVGGLGFWYEELFQGLYMIFLVLAAYVSKKPGVAVIAGAISGLVEFYSGNPAGVVIIPYGLIEGLGVEIGFSLFRYKRFDTLAFFVAGGMWVLTLPYTMFMFGMEWYAGLTSPLWWIVFIVFEVCIGGIFGGLPAKAIAKTLDKSGLLEQYQSVDKHTGKG